MINRKQANLIAEAVANAKEGDYICQFCNKGFVRENTLAAHQCEPKRRYQQKSEVGVSLAYQSWIRFYEISQGSAKLKTYDDFAKSQYYGAFVKFGRYCHSIKAINVNRFIDYVIKNNIKLDHWTKNQIYESYLIELLRTEAVEDALSRAIEHMQEWADEFQENYYDYFRKTTTNRLVKNIQHGRISPWIVYCCDSGNKLLSEFNEEQLRLVWHYIDSDFWQKKLKNYLADAELARHVLQEAGL
jgi:hypothetical protein